MAPNGCADERHIASQLPFSELITAGAMILFSKKTMVNHAKSDVLKAQIARKEKNNLMAQAVALFHAKQMDPETGKPMSIAQALPISI